MKTIQFSGSITTAYGKAVKPALPFSGAFEAYESCDEIRAKNDMPSDDEVVTFRNAQRKAAASAREKTAVLDANNIKKPTIENDLLTRVQTVYAGIRASGKTAAEAQELTTMALGLTEWPDGVAE